VDEFGMCYCGLFVSEEVHKDPSQLGPIPERRSPAVQQAALEAMEKREKGKLAEPEAAEQGTVTITLQGRAKGEILLWRCTVCGYLCAREGPPPVCPICKAKAERFERFSLG
jgi:rubrerythrin